MKTKSTVEILLIIFIFGGCTPATTIPAIEVVPSQTLSVTTTLIPTGSPAPISTPTTTLTPVPTYTPATPGVTYELRSWSANEADLLIAQIASNLVAIENEPIYQGVYGWSYYMGQYEYLAFAEREALLRFPNAPQAEKWRWDLCYNLAFSFQYAESADAPELQCYAKLIEDGLNSGVITVTDLQSWFTNHEARFDFSITSLNVPSGYESAYAITLEHGAVIWLLEQSEKYRAIGLMSSMFFFRESGVKFQQDDLTGDNFPELILYFGRSYCCGTISTQFVYELFSGKPRLLSFKNSSGISTHVSSDYESFITSLEAKSENPGLIFNSHYGYDPLTQPCNLREYDKYYWNGYQFELAETWFGIGEPGKYDDGEFCRFVIDTAKEQDELEIAVRTIGNIRVGDPDITRDQVLYRLGEYHARLGNLEKAREFFESTIALQQTDNKTTSKWIQDAQIFLAELQDKDKFYETCSKILECNMRDALQQLITKISSFFFSFCS